MGGESPAPPAERKTWCCACVQIYCYLFLAFRAELAQVWQGVHQIEDSCKYPPLPANHSGVKVMVAGFAKMGTRTVSRTLYELGLERSYHGEEFLLHVWAPIVTEYWRRPENGGLRNVPVSVPWATTNYSFEALEATSSELLADRISRCKADAVAFDGAERLFFPVLAVSPGTKVLVMNWRTYTESQISMANFATLFLPWLILFGHVYGGLHVLPWATVITYILEPLFRHPMRELLEEGAPVLNQVQSPYMMLYLRTFATLDFVSHWFDGLGMWDWDMTEARHTQFFEMIRQKVPPENRMEFDPRKNTYDDICRFLGMTECRRTGKLPRAINLGNHELDFFPAFAMIFPIWMFLHWLNFQLLKQLLALAARAPSSLWRCLRRSKAE